MNATALVFAGLGPLLWIVYSWLVARDVQWRRALGVDRAHGRAHDRHVAVVDRRAVDPGRLRAQRPALHRDGRGGRAHVDAERDPARPRLLVLLRPGPARPVDRGGGELHAAPGRDHRRLPARRARAALRRRSCAGATGRSSSGCCSSASSSRSARIRTGARRRSAPCSRRSRPARRSGSRCAAPRARCRSSCSRPRCCSASARTPCTPRCARHARPVLAVGSVAIVVVLLLVNFPALVDGTFYGENLQRPEDIPQYWNDAAHYLDGRGDGDPRARAARAPTSPRTAGATPSIRSRPG